MNSENNNLENQAPSTEIETNDVPVSENNPVDNSPEQVNTSEDKDFSSQEEIVSLSPAPPEKDVTEEEKQPIIDSGQTDFSQVAPNEANVTPASNGVIPQNPVATDVTNTDLNKQTTNPKSSKTPLIVIVCLLVVGALGYFVVYPMIKNKAMSNPKTVFENTIKSLNKSVNTTITNTNIGTSLNEITFSFSSSVNELKEFENYTYGARFGIDNKDKIIEGKLFLLDSAKKEYSASGYVKSGNILAKLSSDERLINLGKTSEIEEFDTIFETMESANVSDYTYIVDKTVELLINSFEEKDFTKSKSTITVNGVDVDVTKNTYVLDKEKIKKIYKNVTDGLYNDKKAMEIIEKSGTTKKEFKEAIDSEDFSDIGDEKVDINIYTDKKSDVVGFDITNGKSTPISYYSNEGNFDLIIKEDGDNGESIVANGVANGDVTNVNIKYNNETIITLKISKWTETEKKFDYEFKIQGQSIVGSVDYKNNKSNQANNISLKLSFKSGSDYADIELNLKQDLSAKLAENIDVNKAVTLSDEDMEKWMTEFMKSLENTPFGFVTSTLGGLNDLQSIEDQAKYSYDNYSFDDDKENPLTYYDFDSGENVTIGG